MNRLRFITISFIILLLAFVCGSGTALAKPAETDPEKDRLLEEIARLQKAFTYFQSERDQLKTDMEKERTQNELLKKRLARFTEALQKNKQAIEIYKNRLKSASDTPSQLQEKLDSANLKIVQLETDQNKLRDQLQQMNSELEKELRLRKTQEQMTQEKELAAHDAEMKAETLSRQLKLMTAEQDKLVSQIETLKKQAETDYAGYLDMEERLADYQSRMEAGAQQTQNGLEEIARLRDALTSADSEYAALKKEMQQKESDYAARLLKADTDSKQMDELNRLNRQSEKQLEDLRKVFKQEQQARRDLEQKARELEQNLLTQTTGLSEERRKNGRLTQERDQLTEDLRVFEKALEEERARLQVQEDLAKRVKMSSGSMQREVETLQLKLKMAEDEKALAEKKENEMKNAMDALLRSQQITQSNLNALQNDHQALLDDYQAIQQQSTDTEKQKNDALQNVALLKKALTQERKVRAEKDKQADQWQARQTALESKNAEWAGQVDQLKAKWDETQRENRMLKESLATSEKSAVKTAPVVDGAELETARQEIKSLKEQLAKTEQSLVDERKKVYEAAQLDVADEMERLRTALNKAEKRAADMEKELAVQRDADKAGRDQEKIAGDSAARAAMEQLETRLKKEQDAFKKSEQRNELLRSEADRTAARIKDMEQRMARQELALKQAQLALKQKSATVGAGSDKGSVDRAVFGQTTSEAPQVKKFVKEVEGEQVETPVTPVRTPDVPVTAQTNAPEPSQRTDDDYSELEAVLAEVEPEPNGAARSRDEEVRKEAALMNKAFALYADGEIDKAKQILNELMVMNPDHVDGLGMAGVIAWQEGNLDGAVEYLEKALSLDERNARAHNYMGIVQNSMQQTARAEKEFKRSMELDTDYDEPLFNLAVILATSDTPRIDEARRYYERALALGSERNSSLEDIIYP